jgi:hypothetical protein
VLNICSAKFDLISGCVSAFICSVYRVLKGLPVWSVYNLGQSLYLSLYTTPVDVCFSCLVLCEVSLEDVVCSVCYVVFQYFFSYFLCRFVVMG